MAHAFAGWVLRVPRPDGPYLNKPSSRYPQNHRFEYPVHQMVYEAMQHTTTIFAILLVMGVLAIFNVIKVWYEMLKQKP